jgi:hypothetical protein
MLFVGRLIFPRLSDDLRIRKLKEFTAVVFVALVVAAIVAVVMMEVEKRKGI